MNPACICVPPTTILGDVYMKSISSNKPALLIQIITCALTWTILLEGWNNHIEMYSKSDVYFVDGFLKISTPMASQRRCSFLRTWESSPNLGTQTSKSISKPDFASTTSSAPHNPSLHMFKADKHPQLITHLTSLNTSYHRQILPQQ